MENSQNSSKAILIYVIIIGFWTIVIGLISTQSFIGWNREGLNVSWPQVLMMEGTRWGLWIVISFLIMWLVKKFPISRESWKVRLFLHLLISTAVCLLHFAADTGMYLLVRPWPLSSNSFWCLYFNRLGSIRIHLSITLYWAILGIAHALGYYQKFNEVQVRSLHLEAQLAQAQLHALKMQLHPHFLFNTLNSIASLVRNNRNIAATNMLAGLSDLLRLILKNAGDHEVSLKQELEFLQRYLEIEQVRFEDRLTIKMNVQPETLDARVPNLILQPLVENAIRHGIATNPEHGTIEINSKKNGGNLDLYIRNTGQGFSDKNFADGDGVGLSNTRARLEMLYGEAQKLQISHLKESGTTVYLTIPFHTLTQEGRS